MPKKPVTVDFQDERLQCLYEELVAGYRKAGLTLKKLKLS